MNLIWNFICSITVFVRIKSYHQYIFNFQSVIPMSELTANELIVNLQLNQKLAMEFCAGILLSFLGVIWGLSNGRSIFENTLPYIIGTPSLRGRGWVFTIFSKNNVGQIFPKKMEGLVRELFWKNEGF